MDHFTDVHKSLDAYEIALSQFPASSTNNARRIILDKIKSFQESPSDRKAKELEELGFSVDFSDYFDKYDEIEREQE